MANPLVLTNSGKYFAKLSKFSLGPAFYDKSQYINTNNLNDHF